MCIILSCFFSVLVIRGLCIIYTCDVHCNVVNERIKTEYIICMSGVAHGMTVSACKLAHRVPQAQMALT